MNTYKTMAYEIKDGCAVIYGKRAGQWVFADKSLPQDSTQDAVKWAMCRIRQMAWPA